MYHLKMKFLKNNGAGEVLGVEQVHAHECYHVQELMNGGSSSTTVKAQDEAALLAKY